MQRSLAAFGAIAAGCAQVDLGVDSVVQASGCVAAVCGTNSPQIDHYGMFNFNIDPKVRNTAGVAVLGLIRGNIAYELVVRDSKLVGMQHGVPVLTDYDLVGGRIVLDHYGDQYVIIIHSVGDVKEVVGNNTPIHSYALQWDLVVGGGLGGPMIGGQTVESPLEKGDPSPVCPDAPENVRDWEATDVMQTWDSVVFEGDRFDPVAITVDPKPDDSWWNLGCNRHLLAKLRLTRNTIHTAPAWQNEQAAMKALAAQYCGGTTFTYSGEPLVWRDKNGKDAMSFFGPPVDLEARWDENGALCLGSPRLARTQNPQAAIDFPTLQQAIADECPKLPPCDEPNANQDESSLPRQELVTTGNYD